MKKYTWKEDLKARFEQGKARVKQLGKDCIVKAKVIGTETVTFVKDHPAESAIIAASVHGIVKKGGRTIDKIIDRVDRHDARRRFYDHSTGHYIYFRKKPTNKQLAEAQRIHYEYGTRYGIIYRDMGLL